MDTDLLSAPETRLAVDTDLVRPTAAEPANPVLERLHALVRRGYRAELGKEPGSDAITLRHLGRAHDLVLHSDGSVHPAPGRVPRFKSRVPVPVHFPADNVAEQLRFMHYLDTLPRPTLRDRTRPWRHKYVYLPVVLAILAGMHILFTALILGS